MTLLGGETYCLWWFHLSPTVMKQDKNSFALQLNNIKQFFEIVTGLRSWSVVSKNCTHRADYCTKLKWSFEIKITKTCEMSVVSTISYNLNPRSDRFFQFFRTIGHKLSVQNVQHYSCLRNLNDIQYYIKQKWNKTLNFITGYH